MFHSEFKTDMDLAASALLASLIQTNLGPNWRPLRLNLLAHDWAKTPSNEPDAPVRSVCPTQAHQNGDARDDVQGRRMIKHCRALVPGPWAE